MPTAPQVFYESSNGDRWALGRRDDGVSSYVLHVANAPSGGARTEIEIKTFLARGSSGPEHQALRQLLEQGAPAETRPPFIRHTVAFALKHVPGSVEEAAFLSDATVLAAIPGVTKFERLVQVSPKNDFTHSFSMEFADQAAYDAYNSHPDHVAFVRDRWSPEVARFLEIDGVSYVDRR